MERPALRTFIRMYMRKNYKKKEASMTGTSIDDGSSSGVNTVGLPSSTGGPLPSTLRGPFVNPDMLSPTPPILVSSPFGPAYLSKRSRPVAADSVCVVVEERFFNLIGYKDQGGSSVANFPQNYQLAYTVWTRWYTYYRRTLEAMNKHRANVQTLTSANIPMNYFEVYHDVVADLVALIAASKLRQVNSGMTSMTTYLTDGIISDVISLYQRVMSVRAPSFLRAKAVMDGLPFEDVTDRCYHFTVWRIDARTGIRAASASFSALTAHKAYALLGGTAAGIAAFITQLKLGVEILEGLVDDNGASDKADLTATLDLLYMGSFYDSTKNVFPAGLPTIEQLNVLPGKTGWTEKYCRALTGLNANSGQWVGFPAQADQALANNVPVMGYGTPEIGRAHV